MVECSKVFRLNIANVMVVTGQNKLVPGVGSNVLILCCIIIGEQFFCYADIKSY